MILELYNGTTLWEKTEDFQVLSSVIKRVNFGYQAVRIRYKPTTVLEVFKNLAVQLYSYVDGIRYDFFRGFVADFEADESGGFVELNCKSFYHLLDKLSVNNARGVGSPTPRTVVDEFNITNFALNAIGFNEGAYDTGNITMLFADPNQTLEDALEAYFLTTGRYWWVEPVVETAKKNRVRLRAKPLSTSKKIIKGSYIIEASKDSTPSGDVDASADYLRNLIDGDLSGNDDQVLASSGDRAKIRTFTASKDYQLNGVSFLTTADGDFKLELRAGSSISSGEILSSRDVDLNSVFYEENDTGTIVYKTVMLDNFVRIEEGKQYTWVAEANTASCTVPQNKCGNVYNLEGGTRFSEGNLTATELENQKYDNDTYRVKLEMNLETLGVELTSLVKFQGADIPARHLTEIQYNLTERSVVFSVGNVGETFKELVRRITR